MAGAKAGSNDGAWQRRRADVGRAQSSVALWLSRMPLAASGRMMEGSAMSMKATPCERASLRGGRAVR